MTDMVGVEAEVPQGHKMVQCVSYNTPTRFVMCQMVGVEGRKWWQFWLPKAITSYTKFVPIKTGG